MTIAGHDRLHLKSFVSAEQKLQNAPRLFPDWQGRPGTKTIEGSQRIERFVECRGNFIFEPRSPRTPDDNECKK